MIRPKHDGCLLSRVGQKGANYISLVEAVLDVYKASYRSYSNDQARIYIGRKATDISPRDTVLLKFQGGISDALMLDIAKNPEIVFGTDASEYSFHIDGLINIDNKRTISSLSNRFP